MTMNEISIQIADWVEDQVSLIDVRTRVFVDEQKVPVELEVDGLDSDCLHIKAVNSDGEIIGTARLLPSHYIGRMCVLKEYRNLGVGGLMLSFLIDAANTERIKTLMLNAQIDALPFYQRFGFIEDSEIFMDAGIQHKHMTLKLTK